MNISILSMQNVNNAGSLLQAYGLKKIINDLGHKVEFTDIESRESDQDAVKDSIYDYSSESDKGRKIDRYFLNRLSNKLSEKRQNKLYTQFRQRFLFTDRITDGKSEICVIGSDEVFNCLSPSPWGFSRKLFGDIEDVKKVITYAASCGATRAEDLSCKAKGIIQNSFRNISSFSVKDANTLSFVEEISNRYALKHLDPVLVYDFRNEVNRYCNSKLRFPERYCILYSYHNRIHSQDEIQGIGNFIKENGLELVSVGQPQYWLHNHFCLNPFDTIKAFMNADYVITDTFHGSILAAKYTKQYAILKRLSNGNKVQDLIDTLGIREHLITSMSELRMLPDEDKTELMHFIEKEKLRTYNYLEEELQI